MKKTRLLFILVSLLMITSSSCKKEDEIDTQEESGTFTDTRDNKTYNWKSWVFCETLIFFGSVPKQIIMRIENNKGLIKEEYSAKEIDINEGKIVIGFKKRNYSKVSHPA